MHKDLETKLRRSSAQDLKLQTTVLLQYAQLVRDDIDVYHYMRDHQIGIEDPEYYIAYAKCFQNRAKFKQAAQIINDAVKDPKICGHFKFNLLQQYKVYLDRKFTRIIRQNLRGKRTAQAYSHLSFTDAEKSIRRIGKMTVFVDPDCRYSYRLQDYSDFIEEKLKQFCDTERAAYLRQKNRKPYSFLRDEVSKLQNLSKQFIPPVNRLSENNEPDQNSRYSISVKRHSVLDQSGRFSRKSFKQIVLNTPKTKQRNYQDSLQKMRKDQCINNDSWAQCLSISFSQLSKSSGDDLNNAFVYSQLKRIKTTLSSEQQATLVQSELKKIIRNAQLDKNINQQKCEQTQSISSIDSNQQNIGYCVRSPQKRQKHIQSILDLKESQTDSIFIDYTDLFTPQDHRGSMSHQHKRPPSLYAISQQKSPFMSQPRKSK